MNRRQFIKKGLKYALIAPPALGLAERIVEVGIVVAKESNDNINKKILKAMEDSFKYAEIQLGECTVRIGGVHHTNGFYNLHKETLDRLIDKSDIILTEANPGEGGLYGNSKFYDNLAITFAEKNKKVLNVDTRSATWRTIIGSIAADDVQFFGGLYGAVRKLEKAKLTLRSLVGRGISYYLCASSFAANPVFRKTISSNRRVYYNCQDFCDVVIAEELVRLSKSYKNIGLIYGAAHLEEIKYYIAHPNIRKSKKVLYAPLHLLLGTPRIESTYKNGWVKVQKR